MPLPFFTYLSCLSTCVQETAQIAGSWQWQDTEGKRFTLQLKQKHQKLSGTVLIDGQPAKLISALLQGDLAEFRILQVDGKQPLNFVMRYKDGQLVPEDSELQPEPATRCTDAKKQDAATS